MYLKQAFAAASLGVMLSGTSALALTADQAWADLKAAAIAGGVDLKAATEATNDGMILLNGVSVGPMGGPTSMTISVVSIEEQDDGSVAFFPGDIRLTPTNGATVDVAHEELAVTVFEDEGGLGYGVFADTLDFRFDSAPTAAAGQDRIAGDVKFTALEGTFGNGAEAKDLEILASTLIYNVTQVDTAAGIDTATSSQTGEINLSGTLTIPQGITLEQIETASAFADALSKGLAVTASMSQGVSSGRIDDRNPMFPLNATFEAQPSVTAFEANEDSFRFQTSAPGIKLSVTPPGAPAALPISADNFLMTYEMPVAAPEGGPFQFALKLGNLVLDETIWGMFDPAGALERTPADLALDLSGTAKMDLVAMAVAEESGAVPPIPEPVSLDIKELGLKLAGAALSGTGAFTFDNSLLAMGGPPMPIGTANLRLEGGNKLIDGLIAIGMITEQDAMGARMGMAMFGKSEGDDILTSQIEAKEGGSIFVNGQQIQ